MAKIWMAWWLLVVLAITAHAESITAVERVLWDKRPIVVHIQRNHERIVHFPDDVRYWLPDILKRKVSIIAANGVLYIRALESFPSTRMRAQGLTDQQVFLLDITVDDAVSVSDELIVMTADSVENMAKGQSSHARTEDWRVRLTRYAAQQLYAPERLLSGNRFIKRIPLDHSTPVPLIRGSQIEALPIAAWQGGGLTLTAVKLRNKGGEPLLIGFHASRSVNALNLAHALRGRWLTAVLQHPDLGPAGQDDDTTTLYLVSERPFVESLGLSLLPASKNAGEASDG